MVKIKKADTIGFCFGVKRAVNMAQYALKTKSNVFSIGPIIHNPMVVRELSGKGIKVVSGIDKAPNGTMLIRSHGIQPSIIRKIKEKQIEILDATCPFVERSHRIVGDLKKGGFFIIIVGEKNHPEVMALAEAAGDKKAVVIDTKKVCSLKLENKKVAIIAQSTLTRPLFEKIAVAVLRQRPYELKIFDTLCKDVLRRQREAIKLCQDVDLMLVVGGKNSANTKRLVSLCRQEGRRAYHIESERELKNAWLKKVKSVGIISGSSTPKEAVDKVISMIRG